MNATEIPVTERTLRIALRRVRAGRVRQLLGGEIVDGGRVVPDYVTAALRALTAGEQVRLVEGVTGDRLYEIAPTEPVKRWPQLAFLLEKTPPWRLTTLDSGTVIGTRQDADMCHTVWVINDQRAGYISRRLPSPGPNPECTFRGPLPRLVAFLRACGDQKPVKNREQRNGLSMTVKNPRAHLWLDVPADCRFESSVVSENEVRMVIGHPATDGHTLELELEALRRLHTVTGDTLTAIDNGSWVATATVWVSDPAEHG